MWDFESLIQKYLILDKLMLPPVHKKGPSQNASLSHEESGQQKSEDLHLKPTERVQQVMPTDDRSDEVEPPQVESFPKINRNYQRSLPPPVISSNITKLPRSFRTNLKYIKPKTYQKNRQQMSEISQSESQQYLQQSKMKYISMKQALIRQLKFDYPNNSLKKTFEEMLECFCQYQILEINRIEGKKKWALVQMNKQREPQIKKLKQELDERQKSVDKFIAQYYQYRKQYQAALKTKGPQQQNLKDGMDKTFAYFLNQQNIQKRLDNELKRMYEEAEKEKQQIEKVFALQMKKMQKELDKQRNNHENIKWRIEKKVKEDLQQTLKEDFRLIFKKHQRKENLQKLDGGTHNVFLSSKQATFLQEYCQRFSLLESNIRSKEISTKSIQEEFQELKYLYATFKDNLIDTIKTQRQLQAAEEKLTKASDKYNSATQKYADAIQTQNPNKEELKEIVRIFQKTYDDLLLTVKGLKAKLDTLDEEAKRKRRPNIGVLQQMLKQLESYKDFHVEIEKRILQRAPLLAQLEGLRQQRRQLQDERRRILGNLRSAQEQELPQEEIGSLRTAAQDLEQKLKGLGPKIEKTKEAIKQL